METLSSSSKQNRAHKQSSHGRHKDLFVVSREGTVVEVDSAIQQLKKNGGNVNTKNVFGLAPLHIATWRNNVTIVKRLLNAGADPDCKDGESGWSSLHRALHFGHLAVASVLLQAGASLMLEDFKGRTPVDLLSGPLKQIIGNNHSSVATEVFCWGSGTNYQLGTGNAHIQKLPGKVDALQGTFTKIVAAAKFHSVAVGSSGELYTWGFGRGGRLGHPDFDIHSGQAAVITPRKVTAGLGSRRVKAIAAAKHHTIVATDGGEVFTWGSNREGQLGYTSVDTQPTPRRVSSLKTKIIAVAAANKHSAAVSASGEVFTWGCNKAGQLGYGTSNSASNYTPRLVEYLKGKVFREVSASKYHTVVLSSDSEVYTWGHRLVTPRRVIIVRNVRKGGPTQLKFHRKERLCVTSVTAGMIHSLALTEDGSLFYWISSDPELRSHQLYSLSGKNLVSISAGKYWSAAVTSTGDVYMWDGKKYKDETPVPTRLHGVKRISSVCVGETHLLVISALYHPSFRQKAADGPHKSKVETYDGLDELGDDFMLDEESKTGISAEGLSQCKRSVPTLKSLCEGLAAESLVEPRNALQMLEIADSLGAFDLMRHCEDVILRNLDFIFTLSTQTVASAALVVLANLEKSLDLRSSESWSSRRLPTPTATFPVVISTDEEDGYNAPFRMRNSIGKCNVRNFAEEKQGVFLQNNSSIDQTNVKQIRALRKKLQQIEILEAKQLSGKPLDGQQEAKLLSKENIQHALADLGFPVEREVLTEEKENNKKTYTLRKHRRKVKQRSTQVGNCPSDLETPTVISSIKGFPDISFSSIKEMGDMVVVADVKNQDSDKCYFEDTTGNMVDQTDKKLDSLSSKKKNRKGGLSMFLSGALDVKPQEVAPPAPKYDGPAWGGAKILKGSTSFRDIQSEQSKGIACQTSRNTLSKTTDLASPLIETGSSGPICLGSFLKGPLSIPIAVTHRQASPVFDGEKSTPPWAAHSTSPGLDRPSLRNIQMQQEKRHQSLSHSPSHGSPSDTGCISRWFKPESGTPSSIRSIQIEEKAMKDLKRYYSSVKIVKTLN